ncbi:EamA family transporter [Bacillus sp. FJAT-27245]|uniref:EamA family transporter n=1 Tax=Bacillus sp. FJAT-27245 TaxID=1684144 RepID=UPI0006A7D47D|nr:DMT family transporter [Bacillus sp. FJAT-27245]
MLKSIKYPLFVFIGACSYGVIAAIIKLAYQDGFTVGQVITSQYFFGWFFLLLLYLLVSRKRVPLKKIGILILAGTSSSLTGIFYGISLQTIPASIAIVLLFQFTWIGIVLEALIDRRFPSREKIISVAVLLIGTLLASGMLGEGAQDFEVKGIVFGLLSAVTFSFFIFISGRLGTDVPFLLKGLCMSAGATLLLIFCYSPGFIYDGSLGEGLLKYGIMLGVLGVAIPITFFSIGSPKTGPGLATILGGAELPAAIIVSIFVLKEQVSTLQWLGVILILFGISVPPLKQLMEGRGAVRKMEPKKPVQ